MLKHDSGMKFTSPEFAYQICSNHEPTGLLMYKVNNRGKET